MKLVPVSEAKGKLTALVHDSEREDVTLLRHGRPAAVLLGVSRYEELLEALEDAADNAAVAAWRANPEDANDAEDVFKRLGV